jgi:hypothetical protein
MTFENKCFIEPRDILAVRFRCSKCKATSTIPLDKVTSASLQVQLMRNCVHCDAPSAFTIGTTEMENFIKFNVMLAGMTESLRGRPFEYGFEVECQNDAN